MRKTGKQKIYVTILNSLEKEWDKMYYRTDTSSYKPGNCKLAGILQELVAELVKLVSRKDMPENPKKFLFDKLHLQI